jgi:flagellar protein FlgJ
VAISPPSDIVLDVARAVDPAELEAARAALAKRVGARAPQGTDAAFSATASFRSAGSARGADPASPAQSFKRFEAAVLETFLQSMLPQDAAAVYGEGLSGDMWKSMMAQQMAGVMAERGGIGIADRLLADHYMAGKEKQAVGPVSRGPERVEADLQAMLSAALVRDVQGQIAEAITAGPDESTARTEGDEQ